MAIIWLWLCGAWFCCVQDKLWMFVTWCESHKLDKCLIGIPVSLAWNYCCHCTFWWALAEVPLCFLKPSCLQLRSPGVMLWCPHLIICTDYTSEFYAFIQLFLITPCLLDWVWVPFHESCFPAGALPDSLIIAMHFFSSRCLPCLSGGTQMAAGLGPGSGQRWCGWRWWRWWRFAWCNQEKHEQHPTITAGQWKQGSVISM